MYPKGTCEVWVRGGGKARGARVSRGGWIGSFDPARGNVRVASRGERPRRARAFRRASAGAWDRSRAHLLLVVGGGGGHDARAAAGRGFRRARRGGAAHRAERRGPGNLTLSRRARGESARRGRAGGDARAGGGDGGERGGDAGGHEAFGARRTRGTGVGGGAREGAKTALGDDVAMTRCRGAGRVRWPDASRALTGHRPAPGANRANRQVVSQLHVGSSPWRRWRSKCRYPPRPLHSRAVAPAESPTRGDGRRGRRARRLGGAAGGVRLARAPTRLPVDPTPTRARRATLFLVR